MKTRMMNSVVASVILGLVVMASAAFAQGPTPKQVERRQAMAKHLKEKLGLSDDQAKQIKALRDQFRKDNSGALQEIKALRDQLRDAIKSNDKTKAKALKDQLKAKMESLKPAREQLRAKVGAILTPEQRDMLEKMRQERKQRRQERREKWRQGGNASGTSDGGIK
ncbi:MAG TPA: periplasmic heavy metal sensor [Candidatus Kapabacteria bacterium]|nr:periplasmic heavy metal sensor [Candidatus Kapabacteria bacterium]